MAKRGKYVCTHKIVSENKTVEKKWTHTRLGCLKGKDCIKNHTHDLIYTLMNIMYMCICIKNSCKSQMKRKSVGQLRYKEKEDS